jgi:hypothetical protein
MQLTLSVFEKRLSKMGFRKTILESPFHTQKESIGNLYLVADKDSPVIRQEPQIAFALEQAYKFDNNIYAVYFRHFENNLPSIPQIYIYDYSEISDLTQTEENDLAQIHRNIWNAGTVPFIYVFTANDIIVINCSKQPEQDKEKDTIKYTPFKILKDIDEVTTVKNKLEKNKYAKFEEFSANRFDSGYFFENSAYKNDVTLSNTAYEKLLSLLEKTKNSLIEKVNFFPNQANKNAQFVKKFLLMCILVKYLEDRKDEDGNTVFPKAKDMKKYVNGNTKKLEYAQDFFDSILAGAGSFIDIVSNGEACVKLFEYLSKHFLGTIFSLTQDERAAIISAKTKQLALFKTFLEGKTDADTLQINIWKLYSFQYLPVELISNIYENFLERNEEGKRQTGVVYTPPFLVRLLIDQSMPLKKHLQLTNKNEKGKVEYFKVLDPSCGSGVFLVAAYCRLVQWWRIQNNWEQPKLAVLKDIFSKSIFGVDVNPEAVNIAIFSLTIALLDMLSPIVIWDNLTFEEDKTTDNEENEKEENKPLFKLHKYDFFQLIEEKSTLFEKLKLPTHFDLVIGNPPFATFKDLKGSAVFAKKIDADNQKKSNRPKLPDNQVALLFAEESIKLCKPEGLLCMILPSSNFLYNNGCDDFRKYFLETYEVPKIFDFTHIARILFKNTWQKNNKIAIGADVATIALFAKNIKPTEKSILHLVFKRVKSIEEKMYFELDKYDFHWVSKKIAKSNRIIWKCNYMGGGRIYSIMERLQSLPTLKKFVDNKNWLFQEGYIGIDLEKDNHKQAVEQLKKYEQSAAILNEEQEKEVKKEIKKLVKKYKKATFLTNNQTLRTEAVTGGNIDFSQLTLLEDEYFNSPRKKELFLRPFLIIKEGIDNNAIISHLVSEPDIERRNILSFKDKIIIINPKDRAEWENVVQVGEVLRNNGLLYHFYILCFSGQYLIGKATAILKNDIDALPYPTNEDEKEDMKLYAIEQAIVDDVLTYGVKFRSNGSKSEAVQPIKEEDRETIMDNFSTWFLSVMNSVYKDVKAYKTLFIGDFVCFIVYKGEKLPEIDIENSENAEVYLNNLLIQKNISKTIRMTKIITIFDKNVTYLIKPNQLRYWLPSIAIRDADEICSYLRKKGF